MTKKKVVEPTVTHKVYTGHHVQSNRNQLFGKCKCGAVLNGQEEIDEHRLLEDGPHGSKSVGQPHGPSSTDSTARTG